MLLAYVLILWKMRLVNEFDEENREPDQQHQEHWEFADEFLFVSYYSTCSHDFYLVSLPLVFFFSFYWSHNVGNKGSQLSLLTSPARHVMLLFRCICTVWTFNMFSSSVTVESADDQNNADPNSALADVCLQAQPRSSTLWQKWQSVPKRQNHQNYSRCKSHL